MNISLPKHWELCRKKYKKFPEYLKKKHHWKDTRNIFYVFVCTVFRFTRFHQILNFNHIYITYFCNVFFFCFGVTSSLWSWKCENIPSPEAQVVSDKLNVQTELGEESSMSCSDILPNFLWFIIDDDGNASRSKNPYMLWLFVINWTLTIWMAHLCVWKNLLQWLLF